MDVDLDHDDEVFDPRYYGGLDEEEQEMFEFSFSVNGTTLTITRIDKDGHKQRSWDRNGFDFEEPGFGFFLRVYRKSTEVIPDFTSTVYTYWGLLYEEAPKDTTKVIFAPSVNVIKGCAFEGCKSLVRIAIPDTVTRIEEEAFEGCDSLKSIQLSNNLEYIGEQAFYDCTSLEAV